MNKELPKMEVITTILQEYELMYKDLKTENEQLKERIGKVVEYCENNLEFTPRLKDILEVLKGVNND